MITILVVFIILIFVVVLSKNYFIGTVKNDKLIYSNGLSSVNPESCNINNLVVKSNKLINHELCLSINNKLLLHSPNTHLMLKNTALVNNNYKFKLLNISGNDIAIYHPETNSYLYVNDMYANDNNPSISIGQLNILKPEHIEKAKFNLIYNAEGFNALVNKLNITNKLSKIGKFSLQHAKTGLYISENNEVLDLSKTPIETKLVFYSAMEKISMVNDLINDSVEKFGVDKSDENHNKRGMCSMVRGGLVPSSLISCNLTDDIESFENNYMSSNDTNNTTTEFDFDIFSPHIKMEYQNLFKSYGKNLYDDNLESIDGVNVIDYLKNYHMSLLNKNNELQSYIDKESIKMENILDTKMEDLELVKLNKDSITYFNLNNKQ